jgi:dUTP pyrophosphatase
MNKILVKKLDENAKLPWKEHNSVGYDLYVNTCKYDEETTNCIIGFGIAVKPPEGYYLQIVPRSSIYKSAMQLTNCVGIIDPEYTGEIKAVVRTFNPPQIGGRYFQMLLVPFPPSEIEEVTELPETARGEGGFGSTGVL